MGSLNIISFQNKETSQSVNGFHHFVTELINYICRREQAVEKKYPGTYKRHLVRPIVRSNAVEKLIKKKGSLPHKPGMPTAKRYDKRLHYQFYSVTNFLLNG